MVSGSSSEVKGDEAQNGSCPLFTYEDVFNKHFPFYLSIGMTYEDYWERDSCLVKAFREAYEMDKERTNEQMWLQGLYIYDAILRVAPILQAFAKGGTKPTPYVEKPYDISAKGVENTKKQKENETYNKGKLFMERFKTLHNLAVKQKGGNKDE